MGTRATIAFIDYDKNADKYLLFVSDQFNGDMGPDMANGEKLIRCFKDIYLDKSNHQAKRYKMERIVAELNNTFEYDRDVSFRCIPLEKGEYGKTWIDLQTTYLNKEKKEIDYKNDVWSTWFDYSDYLYIVPCCDVRDRVIVNDEDVDGIVRSHYLEKDHIEVFCFKEHVGTISPEDGRYTKNCLLDEDSEEDEDDPPLDELKNALADEPLSAPTLNTNVLPQKRFVEILTQYKDGDRYCLVVRDSDNKHVLFKEMR